MQAPTVIVQLKKKVRKIVKRNLDTDLFGMMQFTLEDRKRALYVLNASGLERSSNAFKVVKPLFHCMALNREKKESFEFDQGNNIGKHSKEKEIQELNRINVKR